jgi:hypothetical protein
VDRAISASDSQPRRSRESASAIRSRRTNRESEHPYRRRNRRARWTGCTPAARAISSTRRGRWKWARMKSAAAATRRPEAEWRSGGDMPRPSTRSERQSSSAASAREESRRRKARKRASARADAMPSDTVVRVGHSAGIPATAGRSTSRMKKPTSSSPIRSACRISAGRKIVVPGTQVSSRSPVTSTKDPRIVR